MKSFEILGKVKEEYQELLWTKNLKSFEIDEDKIYGNTKIQWTKNLKSFEIEVNYVNEDMW